MPRKYTFWTDCISSNYQTITPIVHDARDITRRTFLQHVDRDKLREIEQRLGYATHPRQGLTMAADYHVSYHRSRHKGKTVYFFRWSCIEHIFTQSNVQEKGESN